MKAAQKLRRSLISIRMNRAGTRALIAAVGDILDVQDTISMAEFNQRTHTDAIDPLPEEYFCARPGYFRRFLYWDQAVAQIQEKANARVILSGFGGDEFLGGVEYEALGLLEHLLAGNFLSFARSTFDWSMARRKPIAALIGQTLQLALARHSLTVLLSHLGLLPGLCGFHHSQIPSFTISAHGVA